MNPDFFKRLLRAIGLAPPEDLNTPETAFEMEPIDARQPVAYLQNQYGFMPDHPVIQEMVQSPFVQDTIQAILGTVPSYGAVTRNSQKGRGVAGFVDPKQPSRAHLELILPYLASEDPMYYYGPTMLHEGFHVLDLLKDDEVNSLIQRLTPFRDQLSKRVLEGEDLPYVSKIAGLKPEEHLSYASEAALEWIRGGKDPEFLEQKERELPGTKVVAAYMDRRLKESENGN